MGPKRQNLPKERNNSQKRDEKVTKTVSEWTLDWDKAKIVSLINHYHTHTYLCNPKQKDYKNKVKRSLCLRQWLEDMNLLDEATEYDQVKEVRRKFHSLRTRFGTENKKIIPKKSGSGAESDEENSFYPSWEYFDGLVFLKDVISYRPTRSNLKMKLVSTDQSSCSMVQPPTPEFQELSDDEILNEVGTESNSNDVLILDTTDPDNNNTHQTYVISSEVPCSSKSLKRTHKDTTNSNPTKSNKSVDAQVSKCLQVLERKDDREDFFFGYCAETMRQLPKRIRETARMEIQEIINKHLQNSIQD